MASPTIKNLLRYALPKSRRRHRDPPATDGPCRDRRA
jgi:hypothetical protein